MKNTKFFVASVVAASFLSSTVVLAKGEKVAGAAAQAVKKAVSPSQISEAIMVQLANPNAPVNAALLKSANVEAPVFAGAVANLLGSLGVKSTSELNANELKALSTAVNAAVEKSNADFTVALANLKGISKEQVLAPKTAQGSATELATKATSAAETVNVPTARDNAGNLASAEKVLVNISNDATALEFVRRAAQDNVRFLNAHLGRKTEALKKGNNLPSDVAAEAYALNALTNAALDAGSTVAKNDVKGTAAAVAVAVSDVRRGYAMNTKGLNFGMNLVTGTMAQRAGLPYTSLAVGGMNALAKDKMPEQLTECFRGNADNNDYNPGMCKYGHCVRQ